MFPGYPIRAITNGVHPASWTHPAFARLFDRLGAHWPHEPELLGRADLLSDEDVRAAHAEAKAELIATIREAGGPTLHPPLTPPVPILAFAGSRTGYRRRHFLLDDPDRLVAMARRQPFQVVSAGKAPPRDDGGKELTARLYEEIQRLREAVPMAFLPGYDIAVARQLVSGADLWLNRPQP